MATESAPSPESTETAAPSEGTSASVAVYRANGTRISAEENVSVERVDFRNPTFLAEGELRRLRLMHQDYLRALASRLSSLLRSELALNLDKFGAFSCEAFIDGLKNPTQITLFRVTPLNGVGFVEIPPKLAVALTNRILGGREPAANAEAYLTEIETALLEDVIGLFTSEWCEQWHDDSPMNAHLIGHETNPRFIQSVAKGAMMLVVGIGISFGRVQELVQIAVPLSMIEPMMKRQQAARVRETGPLGAEKNAAWRNGYDDIAIEVHAEMVAARMTIEALLNLKNGDVIELSPAVLESTQLNVAGAVRFAGRAGQKNGYVAVQITENLLPPKK